MMLVLVFFVANVLQKMVRTKRLLLKTKRHYAKKWSPFFALQDQSANIKKQSFHVPRTKTNFFATQHHAFFNSQYE